MNISFFSNQYMVRRMNKADVADIYLLCSKNSLYYRYCPPFVTKQSILDDMNALPPNKEMADKYYSDREIDEWIEYLKNPEPEPEFEEEPECIDLEERYTPSCTAHDYSPSNPWDAPGMCISDFI